MANNYVNMRLMVFWSVPSNVWDLSSLTRGGILAHCSGAPSLNHWTARKALILNKWPKQSAFYTSYLRNIYFYVFM